MSDLILGGKSARAGGTVPQASFVKRDTGTSGQVLAAAAGDEPCGVSQRWGDAPTLETDAAPAPAATIGQSLCYYGPGVQCQLLAGAGGWNPGDKLKPDANGAGVVASAGDKYGAVAETSCPAGALGQVTVWVDTK